MSSKNKNDKTSGDDALPPEDVEPVAEEAVKKTKEEAKEPPAVTVTTTGEVKADKEAK